MANPLMGTFGGSSLPATQQMPQTVDIAAVKQMAQAAKRMMAMLQTVKDPRRAIMQVAQQNPQLNAVMQMVGGRNPQAVFYEECQKHGVNPDEVISLLRD